MRRLDCGAGSGARRHAFAAPVVGKPSLLVRGHYDPLPVWSAVRPAGEPQTRKRGRGASGDGVMPVSPAVLESKREGSKSPCAGGGSHPPKLPGR
jgi:hypothetical protein